MKQKSNTTRPFLLLIFNLVAIAYFFIYWILLFISILSNKLITNTLNHYSDNEFSSQEIYWFSILGFLLSGFLLFSLFEIRKFKKRGYYCFIIGLIISSGLSSYFISFDWISLSINLFFLLGFSFFFKRFN